MLAAKGRVGKHPRLQEPLRVRRLGAEQRVVPEDDANTVADRARHVGWAPAASRGSFAGGGRGATPAQDSSDIGHGRRRTDGRRSGACRESSRCFPRASR